VPLFTRLLKTELAIRKYREVGHKVVDCSDPLRPRKIRGRHDMHDCPICSNEPMRIHELYIARGKCRACHIFSRQEPCTHPE